MWNVHRRTSRTQPSADWRKAPTEAIDSRLPPLRRICACDRCSKTKVAFSKDDDLVSSSSFGMTECFFCPIYWYGESVGVWECGSVGVWWRSSFFVKNNLSQSIRGVSCKTNKQNSSIKELVQPTAIRNPCSLCCCPLPEHYCCHPPEDRAESTRQERRLWERRVASGRPCQKGCGKSGKSASVRGTPCTIRESKSPTGRSRSPGRLPSRRGIRRSVRAH